MYHKTQIRTDYTISKSRSNSKGIIVQALEVRCPVPWSTAQPRVRGQPEPPTGPLIQRLRSFPLQRLVVGPWGDCSKDIHEFLSSLAQSRVENVARIKGTKGGAGAGDLGLIMG